MIAGKTAAGVQPEAVPAFKKTGLVVTGQNAHLLSGAERRAWDEAIGAYFGGAGGVALRAEVEGGAEHAAAPRNAQLPEPLGTTEWVGWCRNGSLRGEAVNAES